jgi:hypothetical protein
MLQPKTLSSERKYTIPKRKVICLDKGGDYNEKQLKVCVKEFFSLDFVNEYF